MRYSQVKIAVHDHFLGSGDDSGRLRYSHSTPVVGLFYQDQTGARWRVSAGQRVG